MSQLPSLVSQPSLPAPSFLPQLWCPPTGLTPASAANGKKTPDSKSDSGVKTALTSSKLQEKADKAASKDAADGQKAKKKKGFTVPVDEYCYLTNCEVYIDDDGMIYDASLNQTNASNNNNKFYRIQVSCGCEVPSSSTWLACSVPEHCC